MWQNISSAQKWESSSALPGHFSERQKSLKLVTWNVLQRLLYPWNQELQEVKTVLLRTGHEILVLSEQRIKLLTFIQPSHSTDYSQHAAQEDNFVFPQLITQRT